MRQHLLIQPRFGALPLKPLIETELTEPQIRAWAAYPGMADLELRAWLARRGLMPIGGGGEVALRKTQAGLESTRGTAVAATRKVYGAGQMLKEQPPVRPQDEDRGTFVEHYRGQPGLIKATFPFRCSVTFEDFAWFAQLSHKGAVTGVVRNTAAYDYTFTPTAGSDDLKSATFEWGDDTQAFAMAFGMIDSFELSGALGSFWSAEYGIIGADMATTTFTAALADRTVEDVLMHMSKLGIGAAGALPSSYLTGRFIGFKLRGENRLRGKYFADGTSASAKMSGVGRGKRSYKLEVTQEGVAATITERGVWEAGTAKVCRILAEGSSISGSSPDTKRTVDLAVAGKWAAFPVGSRETNTVFTGTLEAEYDATLGYEHRLVVTNGLATLP